MEITWNDWLELAARLPVYEAVAILTALLMQRRVPGHWERFAITID